MFQEATAFNQNIGAWNPAAAVYMALMFQEATAFNQNIGAWNVATVEVMSSMFKGATAFNQSLAAWGTKFIPIGVFLDNCLDNCGMSMANYEATLAGFAAGPSTDGYLGALGLKYCNATDRTTLVTPTASGGKGWIIVDDIEECTTADFVTRWDLSKTGASTTALTFDVVVASTGAATYTWNTIPAGTSGSGTIAASATSVTILGLPANAMIEVKINPTNFQRININNGTDKARLVDVSQWGTTTWTSMATAFYGCGNLVTMTATDVPNLAAVTNMSNMFQNCSLLNGPSNIGTWNTAAVTNMLSMFYNATAFNQNIGAWTTATVTNMSYMFANATAFNQNIGTWNTAAVTNMSNMFNNATAFNQNISAWNVAAVTNMSGMFGGATAFNQNISAWNVAAVTDMSGMFGGTTAFNQNISAWNVAAVTNMSSMFNGATAFNQSLAAWGTKFNAAVNLTNCLDNCGMSIANYDATLAGFALTTRTGRSLGATDLKYCNTTDRTTLVTPTASGGKGWTITGDAPVALPSTPTFTAGATALCTGATSTYTATAANSSSITYSILNGTGASINASSGLVSNITGDFTVVATAANICNATTTANRVVTINANVAPSVTIVANQSNPITAGSNVTFTATPTNGGTTPMYQWKKNNVNIGTNSATYLSAALVSADVITCVLTPSVEICASPTTGTSNSITIDACNCSPTCSPIPTTEGTYDGAIAYTDAGTGVTHYCDNSGKLLLSTKTVAAGSTTTISPAAVQVKIGATAATFYPKWCGGTTAADKCFMVKTPATGGNVLINRWWHIDAAQVTGTAVSATNQLQISTYFSDTEFTALQTQMTTNSVVPALTSVTGLRLYQPFGNPALAKFAEPNLVKPLTFSPYSNGAEASTALWLHTVRRNGVNEATFKVNSIINSGSIGKF
jgi:surface protein